MAKQIQEVFWLTSADHQQLLYVSQAFETIWGHSLESLHTYPGGYLNLLMDSIHASDRDRVVTAITNQLQDEYTADYRIVRPDGSIRWVRSRFLPIQNEFGETWRIAGFSEDITEHKRTEESQPQRQWESQECFQTIFEMAPIGMVLLSTQGIFLQTNRAFQKIFGYIEEELQDQSFIQLIIDSDEQAETIKLFQELLAGQCDRLSFDKRCVRKDGCIVWVNVSVSVVRDASGATQYVVGMIQDISDVYQQAQQRQQAELERQKAHDELEQRVTERTTKLIEANKRLQQEIAERQRVQDALNAQKDFLQTVLDTNPNLIHVKDKQGQLVLANQACADFYGIKVEDLLGKSSAEVHPHSAAEFEQYVDQDQEVLTTSKEQFILEETFSTPNGEVRWYQTIKKPLFSSDGQVSQVLGVSTDITEWKRVQEALRESEQRYRLLIERMNEGVIITDEKASILYVNEKLSEMLRYSSSEMIGHYISEFLDEANQKIATKQKARRKRGESGSYELTYRKKDGQNLYAIISSTPIQKIDGTFEGSFSVVTDITALKAVETELQQAKEQLRAVLDAVPGSVSWLDTQGRYLGVNQHLANTLNLSPDDFIGKELGFLKNSPNFVEFMIEFLATPAPTAHKVIEAQVDGLTRYYLIAAQKYQKDTNVVSVGIDISDVYWQATQRKQAEVALRESREFLQTILDTNPNLIFVKDREGKIVLANLAFADVYGMTIADLLGLTAADLHSDSAEVEQFLAQDQEVFATKQQKFIPEEAWCLATGQMRWFQTIKTPLFDREGQIRHILVVCNDITERKQAEERIQESLQEKEVLLQEIHHRVKNNLQVISSLLDLQSQYIEKQDTINVFRESCNRVKSMALVHEKLYESKDFAKINFAEYVENLTKYLLQVYALDTENITLTVDINEITLNIDAAIPCGLIISELVSNALKYAFTQNTKGEIYVALRPEVDNHFLLIVKDNGVGLPSDFNFKNVKSLGLQLVKVLTNQLEGTLDIDNNAGTEFRLRF